MGDVYKQGKEKQKGGAYTGERTRKRKRKAGGKLTLGDVCNQEKEKP